MTAFALWVCGEKKACCFEVLPCAKSPHSGGETVSLALQVATVPQSRQRDGPISGSLHWEAGIDAQNQTQSITAGQPSLSLPAALASWAQQPKLRGCSPEMRFINLVSRSPHVSSSKPECGGRFKDINPLLGSHVWGSSIIWHQWTMSMRFSLDIKARRYRGPIQTGKTWILCVSVSATVN